MSFKPMLAAEAVLGQISYPKIALPKHNGVRGGNQDGILMSRQLKPIPNLHTRDKFSLIALDGFEGELVVGDPFDENVFTNSTSGVMTAEGIPDVAWYLFDYFHPTASFIRRLEMLEKEYQCHQMEGMHRIPWKLIKNDDELEEYAQESLLLGFEGLVLRAPNAPYKQGRSTAREGGFMRYCPWFRSEAIVIGLKQAEVNNNVSKRNELGYLEKSSHKENKVKVEMLGAWHVRDLKTGLEFFISSKDEASAKLIWANRDAEIGKLVKYKFKPPVKVGGKPRFPQFEGYRHPDDM